MDSTENSAPYPKDFFDAFFGGKSNKFNEDPSTENKNTHREGVRISELIRQELGGYASHENSDIERIHGRNPTIDRLLQGEFGQADYAALEKYAEVMKGVIPDAPEEKAIKAFVTNTFLKHQDFFAILAAKNGKDLIIPTGEMTALNAIANHPGDSHFNKLSQITDIIGHKLHDAHTAIAKYDIERDIGLAVIAAQEKQMAAIEAQMARSGHSDSEAAKHNELTTQIAAMRKVYAEKRSKYEKREANSGSMDDYIGYAIPKVVRLIPSVGPVLKEALEEHGIGSEIQQQRLRQALAKQDLGSKDDFIKYLEAQLDELHKHQTPHDAKALQLQEELNSSCNRLIETSDRLMLVEHKRGAEEGNLKSLLMAHSVVHDGKTNSEHFSEYCQENNITLDDMLASFKGRLGQALNHLCFGTASSNDLKVIIAESNALKKDNLEPHEKAFRDFIEETVKPDIAAYLTTASRIDTLYQANVLGFGTSLHSEREIVRNETDKALNALFTEEFSMSSVGTKDVRNIFDFYLHRHGAEELYDTKLKDGQMTGKPSPKRISTLPDEEIGSYVRKVKQSTLDRSSAQPGVSDMFLRVCGHEYFLPQADKTNTFLEKRELPASYPMVNAVINSFIEKLSLSPMEKYRQEVGGRLDHLIADSFIDFFARLGEIHSNDQKILQSRRGLLDASKEKYAPGLSAHLRKITADATNRFDLFMDIYKHNLERTLDLAPEKERVKLEAQIETLSEPAHTLLNPKVVKPGSHQARLAAAYENHLFENMLGNHIGRA